jgi:hypothetical protein
MTVRTPNPNLGFPKSPFLKFKALSAVGNLFRQAGEIVQLPHILKEDLDTAMGNHNSSMRPGKGKTGNEVQAGKPRDFWTLDEWDRAFDWDHGRPDAAAAFLRSHCINVDLSYLTTRALRGVGLTALYEAGRIKGVTEGEGPRGMPATTAISSSMNILNRRTLSLKELETMRSNPKSNGPLTIFSCPTRGKATSHVLPSHTLKGLMGLIQDESGVQHSEPCLIATILEAVGVSG